jgi:thiol-disulfide isomerase/thioredoxin
VRFVAENYGDSALAKQFGVTRYPAIFVDDILFATPDDFGFYGKGEKESGGRYAPLKSAASHERFRTDLTHMIDLVLADRKDAARASAAPAQPARIAAFPDITITDLSGRTLTRAELQGRVVLVEFWATWCLPCRSTLPWLGELEKRHGKEIAVITIAVESPEAAVRTMAAAMKVPLVVSIGTPELARTFGDLTSVPTLFVFDGKGRTAAVFHGAPPGLHARLEARLAALLKAPR